MFKIKLTNELAYTFEELSEQAKKIALDIQTEFWIDKLNKDSVEEDDCSFELQSNVFTRNYIKKTYIGELLDIIKKENRLYKANGTLYPIEVMEKVEMI